MSKTAPSAVPATTTDTAAPIDAADGTAPLAEPTEPAPMSHREVLEALSGLLLAMFVAMLSSTIVSNALPVIVADLGGTETGYTWVVVATLLTLTATTPLWGKLADLYSKKILVQSALVIFMVGSVIAGTAPNLGVLIGARAVQGIGVGGLVALVQVVIATIVSPRERGRYFGYMGAVFAVATVGGPLIGGVIVDTSWLGWRWCFLVGVPVAVAAILVLQRTLHLPVQRRRVSLDWPGALLITGGVSVLLVWVSLVGTRFDWVSATSALMLAGGVVLLAGAVLVERRAAEPVIPLHLFGERTIALAIGASTLVGVAMFGSTVFLAQYFQLAQGMSPTRAGLMTLPMVGGLLVSSIVSGQLIARTGSWKRYLVGGGSFVVAGLVLLSRLDHSTSLPVAAASMAVLGVGLGGVNQNLVLAVQNVAAQRDMGAASSLATFFRTMGGSVGVSVLGAVLGHRVSDSVARGLAGLGITADTAGGHAIPDVSALPGPVREVVTAAYGDAVGHIFALAVPFAVVALLCILLIREVPLRTTVARADEIDSAR